VCPGTGLFEFFESAVARRRYEFCARRRSGAELVGELNVRGPTSTVVSSRLKLSNRSEASNDRQVAKAISLVLSSSRLFGLISGFLNQT
jgi:hypothetical protein